MNRRAWLSILVGGIFLSALLVTLLLNKAMISDTVSGKYDRVNEAKDLIEEGWLPPFLPKSTYNIREKHNFDYNRGIISFSCSPPDLLKATATFERIPDEKLVEVRPIWPEREERWFPACIFNGELNDFSQRGLELYSVGRQEPERIRQNTIVRWFIAANPSTGQAYIWY